ncbi:ricin B-like lectin R40G3 [Durio zibethinus]|uniref:Ricin B-like lectin R40G3 n=1 Tax=Durio zibethinus TaxID=66656 RepID=A0A6P5YV83_DURZI|nr:ricin B-like lectin R40G3 [Durio zibethinus]
MEFPFGHSHTHSDHHRNDDEENQERPPPHHHHHHHEFTPPSQHYPPPSYYQQPGFDEPSPPPQPPSSYFQQPGFAAPPSYQPPSYHHQETEFPPPPSHVTHVHHSGGSYQPEHSPGHHSFVPHLPFLHHQSDSGSVSELSKKPTVKVYCKADPNLHLTIRDGKVILAPSDPSDKFQHWYKDEKFSTSVKDEVGFPSFALVNKATGQAIKHSIGASHPVQLIPYKPDQLDGSILWSESKEVTDGYRAIRMINNIRLNVDAFHGDKKSGGVHDGTTIVLWQWNKGDNQIWKIVPY